MKYLVMIVFIGLSIITPLVATMDADEAFVNGSIQEELEELAAEDKEEEKKKDAETKKGKELLATAVKSKEQKNKKAKVKVGEKILKSKGVAFFRALEKRNKEIDENGIEIDKAEYRAIDAKGFPYTIDGNSVFLEWKGSKNSMISRVTKSQIFKFSYIEPFKEHYHFIGLGNSDSHPSVKFRIKIGEFNREYLLQFYEDFIRDFIIINNNNYEIGISFKIIKGQWKAYLKNNNDFTSEANAYFIEIVYIEPICAEEVEERKKQYVIQICEEIKRQKELGKFELWKIAIAEKSTENAKNYYEMQRAVNKAHKAYRAVKSIAKRMTFEANKIKDNQEGRNAVKDAKIFIQIAEQYFNKAQKTLKAKENQMLEEIEFQFERWKTIYLELKNQYNLANTAIRSGSEILINATFERLQKIQNTVAQDANILINKVCEIIHNQTAKNIYEDMQNFKRENDEDFNKVIELRSHFYRRQNERDNINSGKRAKKSKKKNRRSVQKLKSKKKLKKSKSKKKKKSKRHYNILT